MKSSLYVLFCVIMVSIDLSCKTPDQVSSTGNPTASDSSEVKSKSLSAERERVVNKEKWLGSEIVEESVNRLDIKLSTNKSTNEKLKVVLTDSFKSIGGELSASYSMKEAKEMGKKIIVNSQGAIIEILENDSQKTAFKELLLN